MTRALHLEDFEKSGPPPSYGVAVVDSNGPVDQASADARELEAFETGYKSGWEDCIAHETDERRHLGADLSTTLSDISIEAEAIREELFASITPVFDSIATQLLPHIASEAVVPVIVEEIRVILFAGGRLPIAILAAPEKCGPISRVIETAADVKITVVPEPAFAEGQVSIRFGDQRRDIDLTDAAERIGHIIRAFVDQADLSMPGSAETPPNGEV